MKTLSLIALLAISTQAHAARWSYSCTSTDGKVSLTRETLVIIEKSKLGEIDSIVTKTANDTINTGPEAGETLIYKDSYADKTEGDVTIKFTKQISSKGVASEDNDCPKGDSGGHGMGFSTDKIVLTGTVSQYDTTTKKTFTCFNTVTWAGTCQFDGEE